MSCAVGAEVWFDWFIFFFEIIRGVEMLLFMFDDLCYNSGFLRE
jgi:hypothetical protein